MYKKNKTGIIGTIITIVVLVCLVVVTNINNERFVFIGNAVSKIIVPIENGLTYLKNKIQGNDSFFAEVKNIKSENDELKQQNADLQQKNMEMDLLKAENANLKEYLNLADTYDQYKIVPGYVINRDFSNYESNIIINIGKKQGIAEDMVVVSDEGVVGYIVSVMDNSSKVRILTDTTSSISARSNSGAETIICRGMLEQKNVLKGMYLEPEDKIAAGDIIETNGLGGIYPKGLKIGEVSEVVETKNVSDRYVLINTYVDFSKLDNVAVIIK
ncbi:MAG: rod shape-determining protein MreC [Oscillospiraceae bacterium]|nr:rod shape-determining protein MreC [Oscillospiraceae bacterium]